MKKVSIFLIIFALSVGSFGVAFSEDETTESDTESRARQAHDKASSDVIYQQEDTKALYYQNLQIIQLLKEMRDSLEIIKTRVGVKTEDKTA